MSHTSLVCGESDAQIEESLIGLPAEMLPHVHQQSGLVVVASSEAANSRSTGDISTV